MHPKTEIRSSPSAIERVLKAGWVGQLKIHGHRARRFTCPPPRKSPSWSTLAPDILTKWRLRPRSKKRSVALFTSEAGWNALDAEWLKPEEKIFVFDFLKKEGKLLRELTYPERWALLPRAYLSPPFQTLPLLKTLNKCLEALENSDPHIEGLVFSPLIRAASRTPPFCVAAAENKMPRVRIGISGWTYPDWRGTFCPRKLAQRRELEFASRALPSLEIDGTFYSLQRPKSFQAWYEETPEDFQFTVKGGQYLTHVRRAKDCEEALCNFLASGLLCLKETLGPILWQFPPNVVLKDDRFKTFKKLLPKDAKAAAKLAKKHGSMLEGRAWTEVKKNFPLRHAFEFRHPSFQKPDFYSLLKNHNIALVMSHGSEKWPLVDEVTADFVYIRLQGDYKKGLSPLRAR